MQSLIDCSVPFLLEKAMKTVAILTGGGDCPGLNAVIRGVVRSAVGQHKWRVVGIEDGFDGLLHGLCYRELDLKSVRRNPAGNQ